MSNLFPTSCVCMHVQYSHPLSTSLYVTDHFYFCTVTTIIGNNTIAMLCLLIFWGSIIQEQTYLCGRVIRSRVGQVVKTHS